MVMPGTTTLLSRFPNSAIFILDGLRNGDSPTADNLRHELNVTLAALGQRKPVRRYPVKSRQIFFGILSHIALVASVGYIPLVHIECHGCEKNGLELGDSGETVPWTELADALRQVNKAANGNLGVVMAVCHGMQATVPVSLEQPAPFLFLIGSLQEVTNGELASQLPRFYQALFEHRDISKALESVSSFKQFYAEEFLLESFLLHLRTGYQGKGRAKLREHLLTEYVTKHTSPQARETLSAVRKRIKKGTTLVAAGGDFKRLYRSFMHGRPSSLSYEDLLAALDLSTTGNAASAASPTRRRSITRP